MSTETHKVAIRAGIIIGVSQVFVTLAGFMKNKAAAIYLGPAGLGVMGLLVSAVGLISVISSMGLGSSAIREVAASRHDPDLVSRTIAVLRRLTWFTGLAGGSASILLAEPISVLTFGDDSKAWAFRLLSIYILLMQLSTGQAALLRGMGMVKQLAIQSIAVSTASLLAAWSIFASFGQSGIVPMIIVGALISLGGTWFFARRFSSPTVRMSIPEAMTRGGGMIRIGAAFMLSSLLSSLSAYILGIIVYRTGGPEMNGFYHAAWATSSAAGSFVLTAMAQDYYPRISAATNGTDHPFHLINAQIVTGTAMAMPVLAIVAATSEWVVPLLFSNEFASTSQALPWFILGTFGRVVSWPMGYYFVARGAAQLFLLTEIIACLLQVLLALMLIPQLGVVGAGVTFAIVYLILTVFIHRVLARKWGFALTKFASLSALFGGLSLLIITLSPPIIGVMIAFIAAAMSILILLRLVTTPPSFIAKVIKISKKISCL